jgi:uncharacterized protein with von Willebrand factor type A (vWA) domain
MFLNLFAELRALRVPVSLREYLTLLAAVQVEAAGLAADDFYHLARAALVKDERHFDRFDRAFAAAFRGLEGLTPQAMLEQASIPADWLARLAERYLTPEERAEVAALGGFQALMETLRQRLAEQQGRHEGGSKWIGTNGTSPFGAFGFNPEGVRIGQEARGQGRAVKVWDRREFRNLDGTAEIGTRTVKLALRRLRRWAREGAADELDLDGTVRATATTGWLDLKLRPERRNAVKVILFLDIGGSMDAHVQQVEALFSAACSEFRHLEVFYFHNCIYEGVWRDNRRRWTEQVPTHEVINRHGPDWKAVIVGDAAMSPYELVQPGGASEHMNPEAGEVWLARIAAHWPASIWINPAPETWWGHARTTTMIAAIFGGRMVPLTLDGLDRGMRTLGR